MCSVRKEPAAEMIKYMPQTKKLKFEDDDAALPSLPLCVKLKGRSLGAACDTVVVSDEASLLRPTDPNTGVWRTMPTA